VTRRQLEADEKLCPACHGTGQYTWGRQCELCTGFGVIPDRPLELRAPIPVACSCGDEVIWCRSSRMTVVAVNADPDPDGTVTLELQPGFLTPAAHVHRSTRPPADEPVYTVHRCPDR
jgi:hypothetical protein